MYEIWLEIPCIRIKFSLFNWFIQLLEKRLSMGTICVTSSALQRCAESQTDRYAPRGSEGVGSLAFNLLPFVSPLWPVPSCPVTRTPGWTEIIPQTEIHPDKSTERTQHRTDPAHTMDEGKEERCLKVREKKEKIWSRTQRGWRRDQELWICGTRWLLEMIMTGYDVQ